MNQQVSQCEIADSIVILMAVEIISIAAESLSQAVAVIEHRRYTIEAEAVKVIFRQPELTVREQEVQHFVLAIVKAKAVPCRMFAAVAGIEKLVRVAGIVSQAFYLIFHGMAVNEVHDDRDARLVSSIDELFQFIRSTKTAGSSKEGADVVTEAAVVRMFCDSHNLNTVVSIGNHTRQHILPKFVVASHFFSILSHADMAFVDKERSLFGFKVRFFPNVRFSRVPHLCTEDFRFFVLHHAAAPCRHSFSLSAFPMHGKLVKIQMFQRAEWEFEFPVSSSFQTFEGILSLFFPSVEIADKVDSRGVGCPFAQNPLSCCTMEAEVKMSVGHFSQFSFTSGQLVQFPERMVMSSLDSTFKRFQPRIVLNQIDVLRRSLLGHTFGRRFAGSGRFFVFCFHGIIQIDNDICRL